MPTVRLTPFHRWILTDWRGCSTRSKAFWQERCVTVVIRKQSWHSTHGRLLYLQGAMVPRGLFKFIVQLSFGRVGASLFKELVNNAKQAEAGALGIASHHRSHVFIHSRFVSSDARNRVTLDIAFKDGAISSSCATRSEVVWWLKAVAHGCACRHGAAQVQGCEGWHREADCNCRSRLHNQGRNHRLQKLRHHLQKHPPRRVLFVRRVDSAASIRHQRIPCLAVHSCGVTLWPSPCNSQWVALGMLSPKQDVEAAHDRSAEVSTRLAPAHVREGTHEQRTPRLFVCLFVLLLRLALCTRAGSSHRTCCHSGCTLTSAWATSGRSTQWPHVLAPGPLYRWVTWTSPSGRTLTPALVQLLARGSCRTR